MHRTVSDPILHTRAQQHVPQRPSRLNPALTGRRGPAPPAALHGRGTVSMPTSPSRRMTQLPWAEPQTARPFFGYSNSNDDTPMDVDPVLLPYQSPHDQLSPISTTSEPLLSAVINSHPDPFHLTMSSAPLENGQQPLYEAEDVDMLSLHSPSGSAGQAQHKQEPWQSTHLHSPVYMSVDKDGLGYASADSSAFYAQRSGPDQDDAEGDMEDEEPKSGSASQLASRRKRQQVRVACTHCQKACKKCSNTRPCERCVKYNLSDCIDSTRKPRKTGVKRGPYRRRNSRGQASGHSPPPESTHDADTSFQSSSSPYSQHELELLRDLREAHDASGLVPGERAQYMTAEHAHAAPVPAQRPSQMDQQEVLYAQQQQQVHRIRQMQLREQQQQQLRQRAYPQHPQYSNIAYPQYPLDKRYPHSQALPHLPHREADPISHPTWPRPHPFPQTQPARAASPTLPGPRPSRLENALTAALSGLSAQPRWVDGQRRQDGAGTLMPHTPTVPFPLSLHRSGRDIDPFSRAVSPIKSYQFNPPNPVPPAHTESMDIETHGELVTGALSRQGSPSQLQPGLPSLSSPHHFALGADTSNGNVNQLPPLTPGGYPSASYAEEGKAANQTFEVPAYGSVLRDPYVNGAEGANPSPLQARNQSEQSQAQNGGTAWSAWGPEDQTTIALKRIRKPSLRTLIVENISREGSPVVSPKQGPGPLSGTWSPGLAVAGQRDWENVRSVPGSVGVAGRDGTMSPTLFEGDFQEADDLDWGFGAD